MFDAISKQPDSTSQRALLNRKSGKMTLKKSALSRSRLPRFVSSVGAWLDSGFSVHSLCGGIHSCQGILRPRSREDVQSILRAASEAKGEVRLQPFSQGKNWGFGCHLPLGREIYLLDLSGLRAIRSSRIEHHAVLLETGVTQGELDAWLQQQGRTHFFNVTGAGCQASVVGNALERGIGYSGPRHLDLLELEVVLPNGELIHTSKHADFRGLAYGPGLGPDATGLFAQASFGVITGARIALYRRPERMGGVLCRVSDSAKLRTLVDEISQMMAEGLGYGVPHIFNRERIITSFAPHLDRTGRSALEQNTAVWTALLPVKGSAAVFDAVSTAMGDRLKSIGDVEILSDAPGGEGSRLGSLLQGRPTDFPLASVAYAVYGEAAPPPGTPLIESGAGLIHITPLMPFEGEQVRNALAIATNVLNRFGHDRVPLSLNALSARASVLVISLGFDRKSTAAVRNAQQTASVLTSEFARAGFLPYRLHFDQAKHLPQMEGAWAEIFSGIRQVLDPHGCLVPSKYDSLWESNLGKGLV